MPSPTDVPLDRERAHLADSRAALARMRAHTAGLQASGGDSVSLQYIRQALHRRMQALEDDPSVPLFFGRLDYATALGAEQDETLYVGRRHVTGETGGQPLVIDWRAGMALPFYRAHAGDPMGVRRRRRFGFDHGVMTAFEDEQLTADDGGDDDFASRLVQDEIERPRTGPMRDIVATIQPEQDVLVRTDLSRSLCIQGAPGTGKTAVGLHRAAFLLYAFRAQLSRSGVLVVGPNDSFLSHIGDVLPALGEIDARQETPVSLVAAATGQTVRAEEPTPVAVLKGDARMAEVLSRAVWSQLGTVDGALKVARGSRQLRVGAWRAAELVQELRDRGVRYEAGRTMLPQRLAHEVLLRMEAHGDSTDDRTQASVARNAAVKAYVKQLWPAISAPKLLHRLLTDAEFLARCADGVLDAAEQELLRPSRPARTAASMRWTAADLVLLDELGDLLERTPSLGHVIVDEAQDLSAMQLRAVGRRASTGSVTLLGDLAQATTPWATRSWTDSLTHLGHPDAEVTELLAGFRVPGSVIDYAARLLPRIAPGLQAPHSIRRSRGDLRLTTGGVDAAVAAVREALAREGTVGVIVADDAATGVSSALTSGAVEHGVLGRSADETVVRQRVDVVPATLAKGLEFDHVVLLDPAGLVAAEPDEVTGLRRLYVGLTRAVTSLVVIHADDLPLPLTP